MGRPLSPIPQANPSVSIWQLAGQFAHCPSLVERGHFCPVKLLAGSFKAVR
jgi:hypothetical protein